MRLPADIIRAHHTQGESRCRFRVLSDAVAPGRAALPRILELLISTEIDNPRRRPAARAASLAYAARNDVVTRRGDARGAISKSASASRRGARAAAYSYRAPFIAAADSSRLHRHRPTLLVRAWAVSVRRPTPRRSPPPWPASENLPQRGRPPPPLSFPKVGRAKIKIFVTGRLQRILCGRRNSYAGGFPDSGSFIGAYSTRGEWPKYFLYARLKAASDS